MAQVTTTSIITNIRGLIKDTKNAGGRDVFEYDSDPAFQLGEDFVDSSDIKVYQNNTLLDTDDWYYVSDTNRVTIDFQTSGLSLTKGDIILITYGYYNKYSDSEIISYIAANLTRFSQRRYKKTFYMSTNNEIVTRNGVNPSVDEGNIIALITAIDIDPQNVDIRTPDFTISASEKMSKSEQIRKLFDQWLRSFGVVDYLEKEYTDN